VKTIIRNEEQVRTAGMWRWGRAIALVVAGGISGATIAVGLAQRSSAGARRLTTTTPSSTQRASDLGSDAQRLDARLRELEARVQTASVPSSAPHVAEPEEPEHEGAPEDRKAAFWAKVDQSLKDFSAEPVDTSWSQKATAFINADLTSLAAKNHFKVSSVECKTTSCLARVEWDSQASANQEYGQLMHHSYKTNCMRSVLLDERLQPSGKQGAMLLFECESWRADGEPVVEDSAMLR
jgi:hypothetical protein